MMNSKFIIECPGCKIRFFVKEDLLLEAGGLLRCGFCDHLFNGNDYIVYKTLDISKEEKKSENTPRDAEKIIKSEKDTSIETNWDEVASTLSSFSIDFNMANADAVDSNENNSEVLLSLERENILAGDEQKIKVDNDILAALEDTDFDKLLQLDEQELLQQQTSDTIEQLISEPSDNVTKNELSTSFDRDDCFDDSDKAIANNVLTDIHGNVLKKVSNLDFMPSAAEVKKVKKHLFAWFALCILALLVLAGQYIRFAAPMIESVDAKRTWAISACKLLLCSVPPVVDVDKITTSQLVIRANTEYSNVLDVDAVIVNQLDISQPFPTIELRFTDLNGQVVASRYFSPKDYLSAEMFSKNLMPPKAPIYIEFSIIDPGETAVGYTLNYYKYN